MRMLNAPFGTLNGLDLAEFAAGERLRLLVRRAARELGFAHGQAVHDRDPAALADEAADLWPNPEDADIDAMARTLWLVITGRTREQTDANEWRLASLNVRMGLRLGYLAARKALKDGIPDGIAERLAYMQRLERGTP